MYEVKLKYAIVNDDGKLKKHQDVLLILADTFGSAESIAYAHVPSGAMDEDVVAIKRSRILDVINMRDPDYNDAYTAWEIKLHYELIDGGTKVYNVMMWSEEIPDKDDETIKNYMLGIDPTLDTFTVGGILKSKIVDYIEQ